MENQKRKVEVFSAGCSCCEDVITPGTATGQFAIDSHGRNTPNTKLFPTFGHFRVPDIEYGNLTSGTCSRLDRGGGPDLATLKAAGLGVPLS